jgi:asparaginyl-tRNA synthetase
MIEPEMAFATLQDDMECAESFLENITVKYLLENCVRGPHQSSSTEFIEKGLIERLRHVVEHRLPT